MDPAMYFSFLLSLLSLFLLFIITKKWQTSKRLPPGSLGFPIIGQSLSLLHAMKKSRGEEWLQDRIRKYGPVSKLNIFGTPTIFLYGQAANKFIYTCDGSKLANKQPASMRKIFGERNILELNSFEHKVVRGALVSFLKADVLKQYVGKMDKEVKQHFQRHWHGHHKVSVKPLMQMLTFNFLATLIIGIEEETKREKLAELFHQIMDGIFTFAVNLPFTRFNRSLKARAKIRTMIIELMNKKRAELAQHKASPHQDLITCLLSLRNEADSSPLFSDEEIIDNAIIVMVAGHDTTSILLTLLVRLLSLEPSVYATVVQEQEEIAKSKASGELLTWDDLSRMKHTWRIVLECLRTTSPVFLNFRKAVQDFEYEGYLIPKDWQVMWSASMTHMDGNIFPDPSNFDPTRFERASNPPYSFVPFGAGPRICPGNEFARIETLVTIHYLVTHFTWKPCCSDLSFARDPMPSFKGGLEIEIKPIISSKIE